MSSYMQINAVMLEIDIMIVFNGLNYKFKTHSVTRNLVSSAHQVDQWGLISAGGTER